MAESLSLRTLGLTVQRLRGERKLTLEELSAKADVSAGFLSQIERGLANPSFETLLKISSGLGVPVASFFDGTGSTNQAVVRKDKRKRLTFPDRKLSYELLTPDLHGDLEMLWVELDPGVWTRDRPFSHQGEECGIVLQGRLEVHLGAEVYVLETGDSVTFRSVVPHWYHNPGSEKVIAVWAITPPSF